MRQDLGRSSPFGKLLGSDFIRADPAKQEIEVRYEARPEFANRVGTIAGGMLSAMLDSSTGLAALAVLPEGTLVMHTALDVEYLRPASPGPLTATARVLEHAGRDIRTESELRDAGGVVVARGRAKLRAVRRG